MRKFLVTLIIVLAGSTIIASAQEINLRPGMKYKELKGLYQPKEYVKEIGDAHSPAWSGVASFVIPGLGQAINNEWGRAAGQFFSSWGLSAIGAGLYSASVGIDGNGQETLELGTGVAALACGLGALAINIWSLIDAVKIAKVKNMYEQDLKKAHAMEIDLKPAVNYAYTANGLTPTVGMSLAFKF